MSNRSVGRQALLLFMVALIIYMGAGFVRQILVARAQREVLHDVEAQIEVAMQDQASLRTQLEYGLSPQAAEEWARENGWARADEQLIVVVAPTADPALFENAASAEPAPQSIRETWWDLFFADR